MSFNFFEAKPITGFPSVEPETEKYTMTLRILGLRGLKSLGLLPIKRPFIKFDVNSLRPKSEKLELQEKKAIFTQPAEGGSNPNICTIIKYYF